MEEILRLRHERNENSQYTPAWYYWDKLLANAVFKWRLTNTLTLVN